MKKRTNTSTSPKTESAKTQEKPVIIAEEKDIEPVSDTWKKIFWGLAIVFTILRVALSFDYGISSDERFYKNHGDLTYNYFTSLGKQDSVLRYNPDGVLINYGPIIDLFGTVTYKTFGLDDFQGRHLFIALFCSLLFIGCGLAAKEIGGWRAATIALIFITLSPRIFGEAMNNAKDLPFAAAYIYSIYQIYRFIKELPNPSWRTSILLAIGIGLAIAVRAGGLIIVPYTLLFCGVEILFRPGLWKSVFSDIGLAFKNIGVKLLGAFGLGYIIGILFWPYALTKPLTQVFTALKSLTNSPVLIKTLFDGSIISSKDVPWYYVPKYISISTPIIILFGMIVGIILIPYIKKYFKPRHYLLLAFAFIFPIAYVIYKDSYFYNGWRHTYFTFIPLAAFAALAFEALLRMFDKPAIQYSIGGIVALGLLSPIIFMVKNHPNEYTYYNEFVGGINGTLGKYEPDYFANAMPQALKWLNEHEDLKSKPVTIVTNHGFQLTYYAQKISPSITAIYSPYRDRYEKDWDYAIFFQSFVDPDLLKNGYFTPKGETLHTINADDIPLCVIMKRKNKDDFLGINAVKKGDFEAGIELLKSVVNQQPSNESAKYYLGVAYASTGNLNEAMTYVSDALKISPNNPNFLVMESILLVNTKKFDEAIPKLKRIINEIPEYAEAYNMLAKCYQQKGDAVSANKYLNYYNQLKQEDK